MIKFVSDLQQVSSFPLVLWFPSTIKTDRHDINEILLKVTLTTINHKPIRFHSSPSPWRINFIYTNLNPLLLRIILSQVWFHWVEQFCRRRLKSCWHQLEIWRSQMKFTWWYLIVNTCNVWYKPFWSHTPYPHPPQIVLNVNYINR